MTTLKLKALFYRYTGIYLAHREENDYVDSPEYWKEFARIMSHPECDIGPRSCHAILIGSWQATHGFTRPYKRRKFKPRKSKV